MPNICVSGATGQIGSAILNELLTKIPASNISATSRRAEKLSEQAALGVTVHEANYSDKASLEKAYAGCDVVMLISGAEIGIRIGQHQNAIEAAEKVGVKHIVYTSVSGCHPMNPTPSSGEHLGTEALLQQSKLSYTALRNHFYSEFIKGMLLVGLRTGRFEFPGDKGMISPVSIGDIAKTAVAILCDPDSHKNVAYEITGPEMLSMQKITKLVADLYETAIEYVPVSGERMYEIFEERGVPLKGDITKPVPHLYGAAEVCANYIAIDDLFHAVLSHDVERITGVKPRALESVLQEGKERWLATQVKSES